MPTVVMVLVLPEPVCITQEIFHREVMSLPGVFIGDNDAFDYALRRFKKQVEKAGILSELKKRQHYEKPSIQKKKKEAAARKRLAKKIRKMQTI